MMDEPSAVPLFAPGVADPNEFPEGKIERAGDSAKCTNRWIHFALFEPLKALVVNAAALGDDLLREPCGIPRNAYARADAAQDGWNRWVLRHPKWLPSPRQARHRTILLLSAIRTR